MDQNFNQTPQSLRRHIAIFGRRNVGKSSLLNALTGQPAAIVSSQPGTTTDPVRRAIELHPLGPCLLIDTAGFDDTGSVGELRNQRSRQVLRHADVALLVTDGSGDMACEQQWLRQLEQYRVPTVLVLNKADVLPDVAGTAGHLRQMLQREPVVVSATTAFGLDALRRALAALCVDDVPSLTASLAQPGDVVLLVMPQDPQAPRGRLILPQVQTIRDLLDHDCTVLCCTTAGLERSLAALREPPALVITDSQAFARVVPLVPPDTRLTSFSVIMAAGKGDVRVLADGAAAINSLTTESRVLIAEACTHAPMSEDIGRVKIPRLITQRVGQGIAFDVCAGSDWPNDLSRYDLVIHCGACMINRRAMLSRIAQAQEQQVPITNYGLAIAHLLGLTPRITLPQ